MDINLLIPAYIAGLLTFLAPCTLPLVPAYLSFISGVSLSDGIDPSKKTVVRRKIFINGLLYILGFSAVFIFFGTLFGLGGVALAKYRFLMQRIGGILVIFSGLYMLKVVRLPGLDFLASEKHFPLAKVLKPGKPLNSFLFGAAFAFGWTPCVGPVLGSILTLAAASATVGKGALLLTVFSAGLATPFLLVAAGIGQANATIQKMGKYLNILSIAGGILLIILGFLLLTNTMGSWVGFFYQLFQGINYDKLLNYL